MKRMVMTGGMMGCVEKRTGESGDATEQTKVRGCVHYNPTLPVHGGENEER